MRARKLLNFLVTVIGVSIAYMFLESSVKNDAYLEDLEFVNKTIEENHPGFYNQYDKDFRSNLETNYHKAKFEIRVAKSSQEKALAVDKFIDSFDDSHLSINWNGSNMRFNLFSSNFDYVVEHAVAFIRIPTFCIHAQNESYNALLKALPILRNYRAIVIDMRGNTGGNTEYGKKILDGVFGQQQVSNAIKKLNENVYVEWRASSGNLACLEKRLALDSANGNLASAQQVQWFNKVIAGMKESIANRQIFFKKYDADENGKFDVNFKNCSLKGKVIVLIDEKNASAALDFLDVISMMNCDVVLIGQKTNYDRVYMEVRYIKLPRTGAVFGMPMKVYRNRARADKVRIKPNIEIDLSNEEFVHDVVFSVVEGKSADDIKNMKAHSINKK